MNIIGRQIGISKLKLYILERQELIHLPLLQKPSYCKNPESRIT